MITHQVASDLAVYSGPSYTVPALCRALAGCGVTVVLHTLGPSAAMTREGYEFRSHPQSPFIKRLGLSGSMRRALLAALNDASIIHSHLLWTMPIIYPALLKKIRPTNCHLVMSPRGTLDPWDYNNHKLQKRIAWVMGQRMNLAASSCLHATAPMERDHFRALGLRVPVAVIPNGVDIPDLSQYAKIEQPRRRLLFFARIHAKKGLDILIQAWRNIQDAAPDWDLQIAGNPNGSHVDEMRRLALDIGARRLTFLCPVTPEEKWQLYRNAELYVLPTRGENWGISVADALSFAVPTIVSKEAPWGGLETHNCGWWLDLSVDAFTECLRTVLQKDPLHLRMMGERGRAWMSRDFSWNSAAIKMQATYQWVTSGGTRPEWISL
jgi:glycosyltransferase involved in cell wall biosynthesis